MRSLAMIILLGLFLGGCSKKTPDIPEDLKSLADAHVALLRLKASTKSIDSLKIQDRYEAAAAESLSAHGFTKERFEREMLSLADSPIRLRQFNELMTLRTRP